MINVTIKTNKKKTYSCILEAPDLTESCTALNKICLLKVIKFVWN